VAPKPPTSSASSLFREEKTTLLRSDWAEQNGGRMASSDSKSLQNINLAGAADEDPPASSSKVDERPPYYMGLCFLSLSLLIQKKLNSIYSYRPN